MLRNSRRQAERAPRTRPFGLLRFALALLVLLQHGQALLPPAAKTLFYSLELGAVAVSCFFALSGFIVAEALGSFYAGRPGAFLANRLLRILPPFAASLVLGIAVQSALYAGGHLAALDAPLAGAPWQKRVMLSGLLEIVPGLPAWRVSGQAFAFTPFAWTLRLELAFYLLAAGVWCCRRCRWLPAAMLAIGYGMFLLFLVHRGALPRQILTVPFFGFGLAAFRYRQIPSRRAMMQLAFAAALVPLAFTCWGQRGHPVLACQLPLLGTLLAIFLVLSGAGDIPAALRRWDRMLGDLSYPLYIGHGTVLVLFASLFRDRGWPLYAAGVISALLLAAILHVAVERPLRGLRDRLRGQSLARPETPTPPRARTQKLIASFLQE